VGFSALSLIAALMVFKIKSPSSEPLKPSAEGSASPSASAVKLIKRGAPLSKGEVKTLDQVAQDPERFAGKSVLVSGEISAVCQAKGCWMTLAGEAPQARARVTFKDYAFFVPKDGKGMKAVVEAEVKVKAMSDAERQHLAEDGQVSVDQIPKVELRLVASGLEIQAR